MPVLEEGADGYEARHHNDVDRSLADLAVEGKVESGYREGSRPSAEVRVERGADMIVVHFLKATLPLKLVVVLAGVGGAFAVGTLVTLTDSEMSLIGQAIGAILFTTLGKMRDRLAIAALSEESKEPKVTAEVMLDEIEGVRVAPAPYGGNALWFDTDCGSFPAGDGAPATRSTMSAASPSPRPRAAGERGASPVLRCRMHDHDVVYATHIATYDSLPAEIYASEGTLAHVSIAFLTDR